MSNITFRNEFGPGVEVLRIAKEGIWANPDVPVDQAAHAVLAAVESNIKELVQRAVEAERDRCILMLERLHERSGGQHNQYLYAAKVLKGEI
jgi:hypothetical protein